MQSYIVLKKQVFKEGSFSIVPIRFEDRLAIMKWRNEQLYHLRQQKPLTTEDQDNYFTKVVSKLFDQDQPSQILFSFLEKGVCLGYGGLVHINWTDKNAEISFVMNTALETDRFQEIWAAYLQLLEKVAFDDLKLHKIYTYAFDLRPHLYEVLKSCNFIEEERLKEHCFFDNKFIDVVIHSKLDNSFPSGLRNAKLDDAKLIFDWANDLEVRSNAISKDPIVWENHLQWFQSKLNSNDTNIFVLEIENKPIGQIRLDKHNNFLEIDYSIDKNSRGLGYGKVIIAKAMKLFEQSSFKAIVKNKNTPSKKVFLSLGFVKDNNSPESKDGEEALETFIYAKK